MATEGGAARCAVPIALAPAEGGWLAGGDGWLERAVVDGGGHLVRASEARAVIWAEPAAPAPLVDFLAEHPHIEWVQLPFAGIEAYVEVLDDQRLWTCAKRAYGPEVAEHALTLTLAALRELVPMARATHWTRDRGRNLLGSHVVIVGGGGITDALIPLLQPFSPTITVARRQAIPVEGASRTVTEDGLDDALATADVVILTLALTPDTEGIIDGRRLDLMKSSAVLVNVARGRHVVTDDLVVALESGSISSAALDVTDPEPLPEGHPLWAMDNCLITPHVANTFAMLRPSLARLVSANIRRFGAGEPLLGVVDHALGY